ncbi:MAG: hypothetical protein IPG21_09070 [Saprospiraceae bacterium]|nr:hypothetical protein [Candidatus Vicinibacter affinis]MBK7303034.1 hypothetical protein [Candidatus Vicinibacter affinis]HQX44133.1 hypothetical protein [Saprospiraceae bacterium]
MALSIMPCADDIEGRFISTDTSFLPTSDHSDHNSSSDHCTPFCICACCGHFVDFQFHSYFLLPRVQEDNKVFSFYPTNFIPEVYISIWQPPKIS